MARVYIVTEEEMQSLIERLELEKLRKTDELPRNTFEGQQLSDMHRLFHFHVVRWAQDMGFKGYRP